MTQDVTIAASPDAYGSYLPGAYGGDGYFGGGGGGGADFLVLAVTGTATITAPYQGGAGGAGNGNNGLPDYDGVGGGGGGGGAAIQLAMANQTTILSGTGAAIVGGGGGMGYGAIASDSSGLIFYALIPTTVALGDGGGGGAGVVSTVAGATLQVTGGASVTGGAGGGDLYFANLGGATASFGTDGSGGAGVVFEAATGALSIDAGSTVAGGSAPALGGGSGGAGVDVQAGGVTITNAGTIQGGTGGGLHVNLPDLIDFNPTTFTVINGGNGSGAGAGGGLGWNAMAEDGNGGVGILAAGGGNTVVNSGLIAGGTGYSGQRDAIDFSGGNNVLKLETGYRFTGNVVVTDGGTTTGNILQVGGATDGSLDVSTLGTQYQGFNSFQKTDASTWTLTGTTAQATPWTVSGGALAISSDAALGDVSGGLILDGGTLQTTAGITTSRNVVVTVNSGAIDTDGQDDTFSGVISGLGGLTKQGAGTLTLTGANTYQGGTQIAAGTLALGSGGSLLGSPELGIGSGGTFDISGAGGAVTLNSLTGVAGARIVLGANTLTFGAAADRTFGGVISGTGGLNKAGTSVVTLTGVNTYTGLTTISTGTLALGSGGSIAASSGVAMSAGATFNVTGTGGNVAIGTLAGDAGSQILLGANLLIVNEATDTSYSGVIVSGGLPGLVKQGAGTLTLAGNNITYFGTTTVAEGLINFSSASSLGTGNVTLNGGGLQWATGNTADISSRLNALGANGGTIDTNGNDVSFATGLTGAGGLAKQGAGTLTLTGANTYAGLTQVSGGTLTVGATGSIDGSSGVEIASGAILDVSASTAGVVVGTAGTGAAGTLTVNSGGTFGGAGTLTGNVVVNSGGTLAPGDPQTTTILGNLTLSGGSRTVVTIASATPTGYDKIVVTGTAALGGILVVDPVGGYAPRVNDSFTFLTATSVTGQFSGVENGLRNAVSYTLAYDPAGTPTQVDFTITAVQDSFVPFAAGGNELSLARALDKLASARPDSALIQTLDNLPGTAYGAAFAQIIPIQETTVAMTSLNVSRAAFGTLQGRLSDIRSGSTGLSLSQFNLMDQNIPASSLIAGTELPSDIKVFQPALNNPWGFFAAANGDFGDIDGATSQSNYHGAGFTAGSDYRLNPAFAMGFAVGYDYSKTDFDHSGSNSTANSIRFGPYATWKDKTGDWVDGTVGGAYHWYDSNREAFMGTATSNTTGLEFNTSLKYGHDFKAGQWTLTPTFGFDYLHLAIDKYTETGSLAPLAIQDQDADSFRSNTGGQVAYSFQWKGIGWNPYVQAGWAHEFLDASQAVSARFASGTGDVFSTTGDSLGHDSATFGAGLQAHLMEDLTVNLSYSGEANDRYQDHSFNAAVRVQF